MGKTNAAGRERAAGTSVNALNARQKAFVEAYLANGHNGTRAALAAGYSPKTAAEQACNLLKLSKISDLLASCAQRSAENSELTTDLVIRSIVQEIAFDPAKLYTDDGALRPIHELDADTRMALTSVEMEQVGSPDAPLFVRKFKWAPKSAAREQAMKHLGMFERDHAQASLLAGLPRDVLKGIVERLSAIAPADDAGEL